MVSALKAEGLAWGGDWKGKLADFDHFQLAGLPASPSELMQADYKATQVPAAVVTLAQVWQKTGMGAYETTSV
jgi:hypothetical protein